MGVAEDVARGDGVGKCGSLGGGEGAEPELDRKEPRTSDGGGRIHQRPAGSAQGPPRAPARHALAPQPRRPPPSVPNGLPLPPRLPVSIRLASTLYASCTPLPTDGLLCAVVEAASRRARGRAEVAAAVRRGKRVMRGVRVWAAGYLFGSRVDFDKRKDLFAKVPGNARCAQRMSGGTEIRADRHVARGTRREEQTRGSGIFNLQDKGRARAPYHLTKTITNSHINTNRSIITLTPQKIYNK